jgi:hypothetical protein
MAKHILSRTGTERVRPPGVKANNGYTLPAEKLEQRERTFVIYRDMGRARSLVALGKELKANYPELSVSKVTLEKWSPPASAATGLSSSRLLKIAQFKKFGTMAPSDLLRCCTNGCFRH